MYLTVKYNSLSLLIKNWMTEYLRYKFMLILWQMQVYLSVCYSITPNLTLVTIWICDFFNFVDNRKNTSIVIFLISLEY